MNNNYDAKWITTMMGDCVCSRCGIRPAPIFPTPYCPYCGAKMDKESMDEFHKLTSVDDD